MHMSKVQDQLLISAGETLIVYDEIRKTSSTINKTPHLQENLTKLEKNINCIAVSENLDYIAISTENKEITIYDHNFQIINNYIAKRVTSKIIFSKTNDVLVADKTGDVFLYELNQPNGTPPKLLLGHLCMILDLCFSENGKYIITCDRDEKIRVSHYPNTYKIASFCLGHTEFVTSLKTVEDLLFSASGDGKIGIWNFLQGENVSFTNTNDFLEDTSILKTFSNEMDEEKVDITALPITNLQIYRNKDIIILGIQLYRYNGLQLYKFSMKDMELTYFKTIKSIQHPFIFNISKNLYLLDNFNLFLYEFVNNDFVLNSCKKLQGFYHEFKDGFTVTDNAFVGNLYKRKFDNVKEYLERKKLRLDKNQ